MFFHYLINVLRSNSSSYFQVDALEMFTYNCASLLYIFQGGGGGGSAQCLNCNFHVHDSHLSWLKYRVFFLANGTMRTPHKILLVARLLRSSLSYPQLFEAEFLSSLVDIVTLDQ